MAFYSDELRWLLERNSTHSLLWFLCVKANTSHKADARFGLKEDVNASSREFASCTLREWFADCTNKLIKQPNFQASKMTSWNRIALKNGSRGAINIESPKTLASLLLFCLFWSRERTLRSQSLPLRMLDRNGILAPKIWIFFWLSGSKLASFGGVEKNPDALFFSSVPKWRWTWGRLKKLVSPSNIWYAPSRPARASWSTPWKTGLV